MKVLDSGKPFAFQIPLYFSAIKSSGRGKINPPILNERAFAFHALLCVGYAGLDGNINGLIVKNSWGGRMGTARLWYSEAYSGGGS